MQSAVDRPWVKRTVTSGCAARKRAIALRMKCLSVVPPVTIDSVPARPERSASIVRRANEISASDCCADSYSTVPAAVGTTPRARRSSSATPSSASRRATCWLTPGCDFFNLCAAALRLPASHTAANVRRSSSVMRHIISISYVSSHKLKF